jgi:hypothetical protein
LGNRPYPSLKIVVSEDKETLITISKGRILASIPRIRTKFKATLAFGDILLGSRQRFLDLNLGSTIAFANTHTS